MSTVRETEIEQRVVHLAAATFGVMSTKMGTASSTGWPDRMFFIPGGKPLMIEFKRPGGKITFKQAYIHRSLQSAGYSVEVHDNVDEAIDSIARHVKK